MRRVVLGLSLAIAAPAAADEPGGAEPVLVVPPGPPGPPRPAPAKPGALGYSHKGQLEASLRIALGLRAIVAYNDDTYCGDVDTSAANGNAPVCTGRAPFSLDFELGYGIARAIDLIVELRVGIEQDFAASPNVGDGPRMLHLSPGARFFFSDSGKAKLFTTVQLVLDFAGYQDLANKDRGADFGVRNLNGLWFDLDRAYGFYAYVGDTLTAARWMRFELEAGIGIQGRYR